MIASILASFMPSTFHGWHRSHCTGVAVDLAVGQQMQVGVEQAPVDPLQRQSSPAAFTDDLQHGCGVCISRTSPSLLIVSTCVRWVGRRRGPCGSGPFPTASRSFGAIRPNRRARSTSTTSSAYRTWSGGARNACIWAYVRDVAALPESDLRKPPTPPPTTSASSAPRKSRLRTPTRNLRVLPSTNAALNAAARDCLADHESGRGPTLLRSLSRPAAHPPALGAGPGCCATASPAGPGR
jgi:hypothetical protein